MTGWRPIILGQATFVSLSLSYLCGRNGCDGGWSGRNVVSLWCLSGQCPLISMLWLCASYFPLVIIGSVVAEGLAGDYPDSNVHGANMGPTWVLSAADGPHVGPMNLAIRVHAVVCCRTFIGPNCIPLSYLPSVYHRIYLATIIQVANYHHTSIHQQLRPITPNDTDFSQRTISHRFVGLGICLWSAPRCMSIFKVTPFM